MRTVRQKEPVLIVKMNTFAINVRKETAVQKDALLVQIAHIAINAN